MAGATAIQGSLDRRWASQFSEFADDTGNLGGGERSALGTGRAIGVDGWRGGVSVTSCKSEMTEPGADIIVIVTYS